MDALIWYSWLGGVIIGTMIGANWVLEDYCREGPRNVVITGRYILEIDFHNFLLLNERLNWLTSMDLIDISFQCKMFYTCIQSYLAIMSVCYIRFTIIYVVIGCLCKTLFTDKAHSN
jgi:hypothetical protein